MKKAFIFFSALALVGCSQPKITKEVKTMFRCTNDIAVKASHDYRVKDIAGVVYKGLTGEVVTKHGDYISVVVCNDTNRHGWTWIDLYKPAGTNAVYAGAVGQFVCTNAVGASLLSAPGKLGRMVGSVKCGEVVQVIDVDLTYVKADLRKIESIGREVWLYVKGLELYKVTNTITNK